LALVAASAGTALGGRVAVVWPSLRDGAYLVGWIGMGRSGVAAPRVAHGRRQLPPSADAPRFKRSATGGSHGARRQLHGELAPGHTRLATKALEAAGLHD
jgi:hypothetical protein